MQYRKRPLEIEAWKVRELNWAAEHHWAALPAVIREAYELGSSGR